MNPRLIFSLIVWTSLGLGVHEVEAQRPEVPLQSQAKRYRLEGTIIALRPLARQLVIDAQPIPGYMPAMTMPFPVLDTAVFSRVKPGDAISADVVVKAGASWLENVTLEVASPSGGGPMVDTSAAGRRDSARTPRDSIGIKPPTVDSILRPNTLRDSSALRYPPR
jgi:hypothetical protein